MDEYESECCVCQQAAEQQQQQTSNSLCVVPCGPSRGPARPLDACLDKIGHVISDRGRVGGLPSPISGGTAAAPNNDAASLHTARSAVRAARMQASALPLRARRANQLTPRFTTLAPYTNTPPYCSRVLAVLRHREGRRAAGGAHLPRPQPRPAPLLAGDWVVCVHACVRAALFLTMRCCCAALCAC